MVKHEPSTYIGIKTCFIKEKCFQETSDLEHNKYQILQTTLLTKELLKECVKKGIDGMKKNVINDLNVQYEKKGFAKESKLTVHFHMHTKESHSNVNCVKHDLFTSTI